MKKYSKKQVLINKNIQLVAVNHGYQPAFPVGSHSSRLPTKSTVGSHELWQDLHFQQKTQNFISPSVEKFYRTNIGSKVLYVSVRTRKEIQCLPYAGFQRNDAARKTVMAPLIVLKSHCTQLTEPRRCSFVENILSSLCGNYKESLIQWNIQMWPHIVLFLSWPSFPWCLGCIGQCTMQQSPLQGGR